MKPKRIIKLILKGVIFLTLPSLLFLGFMYYKNHQELPNGLAGKPADDLATKMLVALNFEAYVSTDYIEWTFKNKRRYKWQKTDKKCEVYWKEYKVKLDLKDHTESRAYVHGFTIEGDMGEDLVEDALNYYLNDVFWLIAPFQVFDEGVSRKLVVLPDNTNALLVTYLNNDAYLWHFDDSGKPKSFNMWDKKTPIDGLSATWEQWQICETGVKLPTFHKVLFFGLPITDLKTY